MTLRWVERDLEPPFGNAGLPDERLKLMVDAQPRVLEVDRVDWMSRDGDLDARGADEPLVVESDQPGASPTWPAVGDAVEIDEEHRFAGLVGMRDARPQTAGHEGQVRIGISRFDGTLCGVQILTGHSSLSCSYSAPSG